MFAELAITDALKTGKALCKVISRNDVGDTGGHQYGFYLPRQAWKMYSRQPPQRGVNHKAIVQINWPDGITTESAVTWYGRGTRYEYRLTRFGKDFQWLSKKYVGCLLVLIPLSLSHFHAHVLETDDELESFQAALGIEMLGGWGIYNDGHPSAESEDECLSRIFNAMVARLKDFPPGAWMAAQARMAVAKCVSNVSRLSSDDKLLKWRASEFQLFRTLERKLCLPDIKRSHKDIDGFIKVAATIMNRRKSRAGYSLEHHFEHMLRSEGIPFDPRPNIDGKVQPDLLIPGKRAYEDPSYPISRLVVVGLKTTCKDRWRQILNEGKRIPEKHLLTLQEAISSDQLKEMRAAKVTLVVPEPFHERYAKGTGIKLLTVGNFLSNLRKMTAAGSP